MLAIKPTIKIKKTIEKPDSYIGLGLYKPLLVIKKPLTSSIACLILGINNKMLYQRIICNIKGTFLQNSTYTYAVLLRSQLFESLIIPTIKPKKVAAIQPVKDTNKVFKTPT